MRGSNSKGSNKSQVTSNHKNSNKLIVTSYKLKTKDKDSSLSSDPLLVTRYSLLFTDKVARCLLLILASVLCSLSSEVWATNITADYLEHFRSEDKYVAIGNVKIEKNGTVLYADKAILYQRSSDAEATGHVVYEDNKALINSERMEINLDTKTGKLYNALILLKSRKSLKKQGVSSNNLQAKNEIVDYWIKGEDVQKIKEDHYHAATAIFTTCNAKSFTGELPLSTAEGRIFEAGSPDWCFKGSDVDLQVGKRMTAHDATYRVKGLPVLYSPYIWAPMKNKRETGFLFPLIGNSTTKGFQFSPSFFWAIDENKDATFNADYYSKRGLGKGAEYRYLDFDDRGAWSVYHLKDSELKKTFFEFKGMHEQQLGDIRGFVDINYANDVNFYREFAVKRDVQVQRFLQSTGEISLPLKNSRAYLLGQYWVDLQDENAHVPQRLPELGYVVNTSAIGPLMFYMPSSITNFARDTGTSGQRVDINPTFSHSFGNWVRIFQSLSLRETAYNLKNAAPFSASLHRETFEYKLNALTRLVKHYGSATHIIEPSVSYDFVPETHPTPLFDSLDTLDKSSVASFAVLNTLYLRNLTLGARITQPYDFNAATNTLPPATLEAWGASGPFSLSMSMLQNFNTMRTESLNLTLNAAILKETTLNFSGYYTRAGNTMQYNVGVLSGITKKWYVDGSVGYDAKGQGVRDLTLHNIYREQCWAIDLVLSRKPGYLARPSEYGFTLMFELRGLGGIRAYEFSSMSQQKT